MAVLYPANHHFYNTVCTIMIRKCFTNHGAYLRIGFGSGTSGPS